MLAALTLEMCVVNTSCILLLFVHMSSTHVHVGIHIIAATALCRSTCCRCNSSLHIDNKGRRKSAAALMMCMPVCSCQIDCYLRQAGIRASSFLFYFVSLPRQAASMQKQLASACLSQQTKLQTECFLSCSLLAKHFTC